MNSNLLKGSAVVYFLNYNRNTFLGRWGLFSVFFISCFSVGLLTVLFCLSSHLLLSRCYRHIMSSNWVIAEGNWFRLFWSTARFSESRILEHFEKPCLIFLTLHNLWWPMKTKVLMFVVVAPYFLYHSVCPLLSPVCYCFQNAGWKQPAGATWTLNISGN